MFAVVEGMIIVLATLLIVKTDHEQRRKPPRDREKNLLG